MGKFDETRGMTDRESVEMEQALRQATEAVSEPKPTAPTPKTAPTPRKSAADRKKAAQKKKITVIVICCVILAILIGLIIGMIVYANRNTDDGRILKNVCAAGVNLGGMTVEEAKSALRLAADKTFPVTDMVVSLPDSSFTLSPKDTGAKLDVDAVVQAAYNYGRTGTEAENLLAQQNAATNIYTIALLPYLNLDLPYIQTTIREFCNSYSSTMTQPVFALNGDRPAYDPENPDKKVEHQTFTITMGTPDYALDANELYDRVLDAYSLNEMKVTYKAPALTEPDIPDAEALFNQFCVKAEDATMDDVTFEVTPEVYGYGFDIKAVQELIDKAEYGETIEITLGFIQPDITAKDLSENMFLDSLASIAMRSPGNNSANRNNNLKLSCEAINGFVLKAGAEFSLNDVLGRLTAEKGYKKATVMVNGELVDALGGGVAQTASALYYCALMADLDILERHNHDYVVGYADLGFDANISWGDKDLRFRNNTGSPLRIVATAEENTVTIELLGTNELDYDIKLTYEIVKRKEPLTVTQTLDKNNVLGYKEGDVLQSGIIGYEVETYMNKYDQETGELIVSTLVDTSSYNKRDEVVVKIEDETVKPKPPKPTEPTEPTEPDVTEPDVTEPDVTEPDVTEPDVTEPDVTEPDVTEPDVTEPDVTEPQQVTEPDETTVPEETEEPAVETVEVPEAA